MKKLFSLVTLLALAGTITSLVAIASEQRARSVVEICDSIKDVNLSGECFSKVRDAQFDASAVALCDRFRSSKDTVNCLGVVANREYAQAEINYCDHYLNAESTLVCLEKKSGRWMEQAYRKFVRESVNRASEAFESRNQDEVQKQLRHLKDLLD